jgi:hypothetical protein
MMLTLHKNATTTPAVRAQIQQSSASEYELAKQYGISRTTVQRWKGRGSMEDRSHTAQRWFRFFGQVDRGSDWPAL